MTLCRMFRHASALISLALLVITLPTCANAAERPSGSKAVAAALQPFVDRHEVAGTVTLVATKDKVLSLDAVGYADLSTGKPMPADALFWIASQSKPITAVGVMMLVDEGRVSLDDPVSKYIPEFNEVWVTAEQDQDHLLLKRPKQAITVRHILSHTSGLPFKSLMEQPTLDMLTLRDATRSYAMTPLLFEPTTKYQYSNAGINTGGRIIEIVSGMSYEDFMDERLFKPLGMKDTTFWPNEEQLKRLAKSYKMNADKNGLEETTVGQLRYPLNDRKRQPMPAGGLFSTAADVGRFCQMVLAGGTFEGKKYLTESAVAQMTSKQTGDAVQTGYGLGWSTNGGTYGHGGAFNTNMSIDSQRGLITVFLVQQSGPFPGEGKNCPGAFKKAAEELFGAAK